jgi:hypothetical protein
MILIDDFDKSIRKKANCISIEIDFENLIKEYKDYVRSFNDEDKSLVGLLGKSIIKLTNRDNPFVDRKEFWAELVACYYVQKNEGDTILPNSIYHEVEIFLNNAKISCKNALGIT